VADVIVEGSFGSSRRARRSQTSFLEFGGVLMNRFVFLRNHGMTLIHGNDLLEFRSAPMSTWRILRGPESGQKRVDDLREVRM
jgi:hypothetical protein